jgi:hypothetical protein
MTTLEIVRIASGRSVAKGWIARCPAHQDRLPSLSIREGREGRTLLRCFAGCDTSAITLALGLKLTDLFVAHDHRLARGYGVRPAPRSADIEVALRDECARIMTDEADRVGFPAVTELVRHRNEARVIIERRYGVCLKREVAPWTEVEPHCVDPTWKMCIDQALNIAAAHCELTFETLRKTIAGLPGVQHRVILLARQLQCELATGKAAT